MREELLHLLMAIELASILLGWIIVIGGVVYAVSKGGKK